MATSASETEMQHSHNGGRVNTIDILHKLIYPSPQSLRKRKDAALIVLNTPISSKELFESAYAASGFVVYADGGANRVFDLYSDIPSLRDNYLPNLVHGDLDSIRRNVKDFYASQGVSVSRNQDLYSTDFGKAISKTIENFQSSNLSPGSDLDVIVLGSLGGRVDQGVGLLNEIYREETRLAELRICLVSETSVSILMRPNVTNEILLGRNIGKGEGIRFERNVGILPLYGAARISLTGLEWDVKNWPTAMGGDVSTSNHVVAEDGKILIETDVCVLFTIEISIAGFKY